jgi:hypothetical protein
MKQWQSGVAWVLGAACLIAGGVNVWLADANQRMQLGLQEQRTRLERGILGPQGQQVGNNILQDLAAAAQRDEAVLGLLNRYGFQVQAPAAATNAAAGAATTTGTGGAQ